MKIILLFSLMIQLSALGKSPLTTSRLTKLSGEGDTSLDSKSTWDKRYNKKNYVYGKLPAKFLAENYNYLKPSSRVLDMGMGEGRNAVFLAQKGHQVTGIDISSVAVKKARLLAKEKNVVIKSVVGTLNKYKIKPESFDAIICFYYVDRELNKKMIEWLKPAGIIIYEAYTTEQNKKKSYYLKPQELLTMFPDTHILKFQEPKHEKEFRSGIILQKI